MSHPIPFMKASNVQAPKKAAKEAPDLEEAIEEEDEAEVVAEPSEAADGDDDLDLKGDKYIGAFSNGVELRYSGTKHYPYERTYLQIADDPFNVSSWDA